jgi:hypothetical protein
LLRLESLDGLSSNFAHALSTNACDYSPCHCEERFLRQSNLHIANLGIASQKTLAMTGVVTNALQPKDQKNAQLNDRVARFLIGMKPMNE